MLTVHLRFNDSSTKQAVPVRLRISEESGRYFMPHGRVPVFSIGVGENVGGHLKQGREMWCYIDGSCEVPLPTGVPLRVQASRGPEYELLDEVVTLGPGKMALRFEMKRWSQLESEDWISADARAHELPPHAALLEAGAEDLHIVNLLARVRSFLGHDGNTYPAMTNLLAFSGQDSAMSTGSHAVVVNTWNVHRALGALSLLHSHRVVYPLAFGEPDDTDDWGLCDWCDQCHRKNGLAVWSDPFRHDAALPGGEALVAAILGKVDALEITSAMLSRGAGFLVNIYRLWNAGFRIPLVGASAKDSNKIALGAMRTYAQVMPNQERNYVNWVAAVKAGRTFVSSGPLLKFELSAHGETVMFQSHVESTSAFAKLEVLFNGNVITTAPAQAMGTRFHATLPDEYTPVASGWFAARCIGAHGVFAHTSPHFVSLENKPGNLDGEARSYLNDLVQQVQVWSNEQGQYREEKFRAQLLEHCQAARDLLAIPSENAKR